MPKSSGRKPSKGRPRSSGPARSARPSSGSRPADDGPVQPGRRPSPPGFLLAVACVWIVCGVIALVSLKASWRLVPAIVFIGIGLLFLRGAAATVVRREQRKR